jgi:hypothetical protein
VFYAAVVAGDAVALTTRAAATGRKLFVRPLEPARHVRFALLSRDETPAPALAELLRAAQAGVEPPRAATRPALAAVAGAGAVS